ncbi:hypothetical protein KHC28_00245 [Ancylobacter sonchi]|uniref:hypothetical protein n=1 Tax=Ancylobacter sonchi TaxID=1937790 RepID=UPI001BD50098|nr:hypothetical protein [Ancylobacter sonchi]MBS7532094.1 hypothetical protein [Ancylobacter sonchi]
MLNQTIVIIGIGLALAGCVTTQTTTFSPTAGQSELVRNGRPGLVSNKGHTEVAMVMKKPAGPAERPTLIALLCNRSPTPITFRYGDITASGGDGAPLKVWNRAQLQQEARTDAILAAAVGAATSAALVQINSPTYSTPAANNIVDASATASANIAAAGALARGAVDVAMYENTMLADNTVMPGECVGGMVVVDLDRRGGWANPHDYQVRIPFGGDVHVIRMTVAPSSNK